MLDAIRKKKENFFYTFIILAVVAVMCFFGMGKMGGSGNRGQDGAAADVNGEIITQREFRQAYEYKLLQYQSMLGGQYDEKLLTALQVPQRTLQELVQYKLLAQQAKKFGIIVPDFELAENIRSLPMYQKDGKFDAELYSKLPDRGLEERSRREHLATAKLQNYLADRIRMTPAELKSAFLLKDTKVDLDYAKIDFGSLAPKTPPTAKEMADFLKATPESELKTYYDEHKKDYTEKATAQIRQIRVGIPFKAADAIKAEAKKKIDLIAKDTTAENFEQTAKAKSDDEYAKKGGNRGWIARGSLEKPLEDAMDKLTIGQVSPPIETAFGYFIIQVLAKKDAVTKPFEEVKKSIAEVLVLDKRKKTFADDKRAQWDALLASGKPLDSELKKDKIEIKKTGSFSIGQGFIPNIGQVDSMVDAVFTLTKENPIPKKLFFFQDNYYYIKLANMELPKAEEFAKTEEALEKTLVTSLQGEVIGHWVADLEKHSTIKSELGDGKQGGQQQAPEED